MEPRSLRRLSAALAILVVTAAGSAKAETVPQGDCGTEVDALNKEWSWTWPRMPSPKPGNNMFVEDRRGHRYTVTEYESMHRRLNRSRKLCRDGSLDEAHAEMVVLHGWLDEVNGQSTPK